MKFKDFLFEEKKLPQIYCDLDGVLVAWDQGFKNLSGMSVPEYEQKHGINSYAKLIAKEGGEDWWANLEWQEDGKELWNYIKRYKPIILSAPTRTKIGRPTCISGKKKWLKRELPGIPYILEINKHKHANPNSLLIDDFSNKIKKWEEAKGIGLLHKNTKDTIKKLKQLGFTDE